MYNPSAHRRTARVRIEFVPPASATSFLAPSVYLSAARHSARQSVAIPAQIELNDRLTSQLTGSHHAPPPLAHALYLIADVPALGTRSLTIQFEKDSAGKYVNSTSTEVPSLLLGAEPVSRAGTRLKYLAQALVIPWRVALAKHTESVRLLRHVQRRRLHTIDPSSGYDNDAR